jgi:phospholipase/carboxylesterase
MKAKSVISSSLGVMLALVNPIVPGVAQRSSSARLGLSRRHLLLGSVVSSVWACQAGDVAGSAAPAPRATNPGGLDVVRLGSLREDERGGTLVVLLHGWRAPGGDLVPLARRLAHPRARFLVPAAPLAEPGGGRAWWRLDGPARPVHAHTDELPKDHRPNPEVSAARQAIQALLRDARERYAPDAIAIAGFSQGAMLALDVAIAADPPVTRAAALSGVVLADSLPALQRKQAIPPSIFVAHGSRDPVLPYAGGASIEKLLSAHGYPVSFFPFEGGHEIPPAVVTRLGQFLFG